MRIADPGNKKNLTVRTNHLLDRTPIDFHQAAKSERTRKARSVVLAAVLTTIVLSLSAFALQPLDGASEAPRKATASYLSHDSILILGDTEFTPDNGVTGGAGTPTDPYVINGWEINATFTGSGIMIYGTTEYYQISNLRVFGLGANSIVLYEAPHGTVNDSLVENTDMAILVLSSDDMSIVNNTVLSQTYMGIAVSNCNMVEIGGNDLDQIESGGILVMESSNVSVHDNTVTNVNGMGIGAEVADNVEFLRNNASSTTFCGLFVNDTRNATIQDNDLTMNDRFGLYVGNVSGVSVFHNRFIGNPEQAVQGPNTTSLAWDNGYPSGGNYWSDYPGTDGDGDGIGDTPYAVSGGGTDRYPFVDEDMKFIPEFGAIMVPIIGMAAMVVVLQRRRKARTT